MVNAEQVIELHSQLRAIDVGIVDPRQLAYRVLTVLPGESSIAEVNDLERACRGLMDGNPDFATPEQDWDELEFFADEQQGEQ